ncbi:MAG: outer membrane lipoprotein carrier protein LolA [Myxococcales bacterium]|nr:outer membrane lipoprotein carrier protein LolA [Myxococcales bacterium]USN51611.1 MAG: outer membrane lipoprotein carrier protein LolA [Myxococcales bacterium]
MKFIYLFFILFSSYQCLSAQANNEAKHNSSEKTQSVSNSVKPAPQTRNTVPAKIQTPVNKVEKVIPQKKPTATQASALKPTPNSRPTTAQLMQLADIIQKQYNKTKSARFDFEQNYKSPYLPITETSKGQVFFKARNMLWRYNEPASRKKEFYIEGKKFTYHLVNDKQAFTHDCFEQDTLSASISFLWGQGNLKNSFEIKEFQGAVNDQKLKWLTLIPKEKNAPIKSVSLGVDQKTGTVVESIVTDLSNGTNSFRFSNFQINLNIADKTFHFVAAPGVKVQAMPNVECAPPPKQAPQAASTTRAPQKTQAKAQPATTPKKANESSTASAKKISPPLNKVPAEKIVPHTTKNPPSAPALQKHL